MKRGLVVRDAAEISDAEWQGRVEKLQGAMVSEGLAFALVYGDVFRSDDIAYLTNLCIYWNEGVVAVPQHGEAIFLTKLSPRVHTWMRKTSTMTDLRSGKTFGELVSALVSDGPIGDIGIVDAALWPAAVLDEIRRSVPGRGLRLLGSLVRDQRAHPSPAEIELLRTGSALLSDAVDAALESDLSVTERIAQLERDIRGAGFTDTTIEASNTDDGLLSLQVTGQYRHAWPTVSRMVETKDDISWAGTLSAALAAVAESTQVGSTREELRAVAERQLEGLPTDAVWQLRLVNQADMSTSGEFLFAEQVANQIEEGEAIVVSIEVLHSSHDRSVVAETVLITHEGAERLTASRD